MLLQPLVENAILHGLAGLDRPGEVRISGRVEDAADPALLLEVRDNGRGMAPELVRAALAAPPARHHGLSPMGLYNVERRVKLNHGPAFGLQVESEPEARGVASFTVVRLRLPVLTEPPRQEPGDGAGADRR
jgi:two-component system sensor histidine kinase YesM